MLDTGKIDTISNQITITDGLMDEKTQMPIKKEKQFCLSAGRYSKVTEDSFRVWFKKARSVFGL